jgi:hypothetical protein
VGFFCPAAAQTALSPAYYPQVAKRAFPPVRTRAEACTFPPGVILLRFELIGADPAHTGILRLDLNAGAAGYLLHEQIELVSLSSISWDVHDVIRVVDSGILVESSSPTGY